MMMNIELEELFPWLQKKFQQKYGDRLELLKKTFLVFYNLTQQIINIYNDLYDQCLNSNDKTQQQVQQLKTVVNRTTIILHRLVQNEALVNNKPGAINLTFCQKFLRYFGENLNILCTYYHSLNHCELVLNKYKYQKKKIVQGINKLYVIHNKIRELYSKNVFDLKVIQKQKYYVALRVKHILLQRQLVYKCTKVVFYSVQDIISQFYENFQQKMKYTKNNGSNQAMVQNTAQQTIKKLMRNYFRVLHQFYQTQAELEYYIKPIIFFCEQIKNNKKTMNYAVADAINLFSRITSQLLKTNYSLKNFKKIRMQDLNKSLLILLEQIMTNHQFDFKNNGQFLGHRIYKQLGIGIYKNDKSKKDKQRQKQKQREKQKEKERQRQRQRQRQKLQQKIKNRRKISDRQIPNSHNSRSKQIGRSKQSKFKSQQAYDIAFGSNNEQGQINLQQNENLNDSQTMQGDKQGVAKQQNLTWTLQNETPKQKIQTVVEQIIECCNFILDCMKQLQKVQGSGLLNMIQQYKQKLNISSGSNSPTNTHSTTNLSNQYQSSKKVIIKLCEYQQYISEYYKLHQNIKQFQKVLRQIVLLEFNIKINVNIGMQPIESDKQTKNNKKNSEKDYLKQEIENQIQEPMLCKSTKKI